MENSEAVHENRGPEGADRHARLFTAEELAGVVGGTCRGKLDAEIFSVAADSRAVRPGSLFVALSGERTDGHQYLRDAVAAGASALLISIAKKENVLGALRGLERAAELGLIFVESPLAALQSAAREHRQRHSFTRIGVTGSSGKTTTKECIGAVLAASYPPGSVAMSPGNLNSDIGLALALFDLRSEHQVGVFEMGINRVGEMDELARMYEPQIAVVTNIGTAHVGIFGTRDGIAHEKSRIFSHFSGTQRALIWEDDDYRAFLASRAHGRVSYFGLRNTEGLGAIENRGVRGWSIAWRNQRIEFALPGRHNLINACAALSVANVLGLDPEKAARGLSGVQALFGRSEIREGAITIVQDCYNANPDSVASAIEFFAELPPEGRKILVLGSMRELGDATERAHRGVGTLAGRAAPAAIFLFGDEMRAAEEALSEDGFGGSVLCTSDFDELSAAVRGFVRAGDFVLIKGSRAMALERLVSDLERAGLLPAVEADKGGSHAS